MDLFQEFLKKYPPEENLTKPSAELLEKFRDRLPEKLLAFWQEYGFGNYGNGFFKVINPCDYTESLYSWLCGENPTRIPIMITAFGDIFYYRKVSDTEDDVCVLDIHYRQTILCAYSFDEFFEDFIVDDELKENFNYALFEEALQEKGELKANEIYYFVPALALGGAESIEYISKGEASVHQMFLFLLTQTE